MMMEFGAELTRQSLTFMHPSMPDKRTRAVKITNARRQDTWRQRAGTIPVRDGAGVPAHATTPGDGPAAGFGARLNTALVHNVPAKLPARPDPLSGRAENVLKEWAAGMTGEAPPKGRWTPPGDLLRRLRFSDLATARNCGPRTVDEIIGWARSQGVVIQRPFHAGKSLSAMWRDIVAKASAGEFSRAEIAEALERSARRKNTRIPVAFQTILLKALNAAGK
jgi:hypothetical protein